MNTPRHSPARPVRATRATPPAGAALAVGAPRARIAALVMLSVLTLSSAAVATWFGTRATRLQHELAHQTALLDKSVAKLNERDAVLSALLDADGALAVAHLLSDSSGVGVSVYSNRRDGRSMVAAFGLPALPRERTYALWVGDSAHLRIASHFNTDAKGRGLSRQFMIPPESPGVLQLLLTVELANPGRVPNLPAVLTGRLQTDSLAFPSR